MVEETNSARDFAVGKIVRATIKIVDANLPYFLVLTVIGWTAQESLSLLTGEQHLFEPIHHGAQHVIWSRLVWDGLNGLIDSVFSSAIVLRAHATLLGKKGEWLRELSDVFQSAFTLLLYALVFVAILTPFLLLTALLPIVGARYAGLFLIVVFCLSAILALVALAWSVVIPVIVIERQSLLSAMRRSGLLTRHHRGTIFGVIILFAICLITPQILVSLSLHQKLSPAVPAMLSASGILRAFLAIIGAMFSGAGIGVIYELLAVVPMAPVAESERIAT